METQAERYKTTLAKYLPAASIEAVFQFLTQENQVSLHITRERHSKLGDYSWPQTRRNYHKISINGNLNPYFFLWVLLHEMAHLNTWKQYGTRVQPHGHEWQYEYASLIHRFSSIGDGSNFPEEIQELLPKYLSRIPLNQALGREIEKRLHHYDSDYDPADEPLRVSDLDEGDLFSIIGKENLQFKLLERRRTRYKCQDIVSGKLYTVSGEAPVTRL